MLRPLLISSFLDKLFLCALFSRRKASLFCYAICLAFFAVKLNAQNRQVDSIKILLRNSGQDTNRVNALNNLSKLYMNRFPDSAMHFADQALAVSKTINDKKGAAWAELCIGTSFFNQHKYQLATKHCSSALKFADEISSAAKTPIPSITSLKARIHGCMALICQEISDYYSALDHYDLALKYNESVGDKKGAAKVIGNIAVAYLGLSDYPNALANSFKNLKFSEELGDKQSIGASLCNIAIVYQRMGDYAKALDYYFKGLKASEEVDDQNQMGRTYSNIAGTYGLQSDFKNALEYYTKSMTIFEKTGNKFGIAKTMGNMAIIYSDLGDFSKAMENYSISLKLKEEIGDRQGAVRTMVNIASTYIDQKLYKQAENYLTKANKGMQGLGTADLEAELHKYLAIVYENTNRPALSLEHYKKFVVMNDTLYSNENKKKIMRSELEHEYEKKKAVADAEHKVQMDSQKEVAAERSKKQSIIIGAVVAGLLLVLIFAGFVFRSLQVTKKQKLIIERKNRETETQKLEIEAKQKEILDSIHYAKRIQLAQIPSEKRVAQMFGRFKK